MVCELIGSIFRDFQVCEETADGARIATHCLYPSFETVYVYVAKVGDLYSVHDGGGAERAAWLHARDHNIITRALNREAERFHLECTKGSLVSDGVTIEWLQSAVLAVANASSFAANNAVSRAIAAAEKSLIENIAKTLEKSAPKERIAREVTLIGRSGGERHFDFSVRTNATDLILINGVSPHPSSVSFKYVSFSDIEADRKNKLAVYSRPLETNDTALLEQVASILPLAALATRTTRALAHAD